MNIDKDGTYLVATCTWYRCLANPGEPCVNRKGEDWVGKVHTARLESYDALVRAGGPPPEVVQAAKDLFDRCPDCHHSWSLHPEPGAFTTGCVTLGPAGRLHCRCRTTRPLIEEKTMTDPDQKCICGHHASDHVSELLDDLKGPCSRHACRGRCEAFKAGSTTPDGLLNPEGPLAKAFREADTARDNRSASVDETFNDQASYADLCLRCQHMRETHGAGDDCVAKTDTDKGCTCPGFVEVIKPTAVDMEMVEMVSVPLNVIQESVDLLRDSQPRGHDNNAVDAVAERLAAFLPPLPTYAEQIVNVLTFHARPEHVEEIVDIVRRTIAADRKPAREACPPSPRIDHPAGTKEVGIVTWAYDRIDTLLRDGKIS
jgi:hypothetical protein